MQGYTGICRGTWAQGLEFRTYSSTKLTWYAPTVCVKDYSLYGAIFGFPCYFGRGRMLIDGCF